MTQEAERALALDPQNNDALLAQLFVIAPFGRFVEADAVVERMRRAPGSGAGRIYVGWYIRNVGRVRESLEETERAYRLDALDPMSANMVALARMAAGRVAEAVPVLEDLMARVPDMSFPVANLMRAKAFLGDWAAVDRLLDPAANRPLREFQDGLTFIRAKRDPTPENIGAHPRRARRRTSRKTAASTSRGSSMQRTLAWSTKPTGRPRPRASVRAAPRRHHGPGRLPHRRCCSMPACPNCATIRASCPCARGSASSSSGWRPANGPTASDEVPYDFKAECEKARQIPIEEFGF